MYDAETETMPRCRSVETETLEWHYQDETDVQKRLRPSQDWDVRDRDYNAAMLYHHSIYISHL